MFIRQELRSNAIRILGSVDFLGNPLGLMVDFKESFSNVLSNGEVTDFVFSITHGVAKSLSKLSTSLSDSISTITIDDSDETTRNYIRSLYSSGHPAPGGVLEHVMDGAVGFVAGLFGGAMSLGTQTYRGFARSGVSGALTGLGRGALGTVGKPIVGALDLAASIAGAIRETSRWSGTVDAEWPRVREIRSCCALSADATSVATPSRLLKPFSRVDAYSQMILYQVNGLDLTEKYVGIENLKPSSPYEAESNQPERMLVISIDPCKYFENKIRIVPFLELGIEPASHICEMRGERVSKSLRSSPSAVKTFERD